MPVSVVVYPDAATPVESVMTPTLIVLPVGAVLLLPPVLALAVVAAELVLLVVLEPFEELQADIVRDKAAATETRVTTFRRRIR
jgi:hypothetical protein